METIKTVFVLLELAILIYLGISSVYFLVFAIASHFYKEKNVVNSISKYRVLLLIPSYKEDSVIVETAKSALEHCSIKSDIDVMVIADSLKPSTIEKLRFIGTNVLPVSFEKSTKAKSLNCALDIASDKYDYALVLDADNIMAPGFVDKMIERLEQGFKIVQGHRTAKNSNTDFALLDGLSEEVNNAIFRRGHRTLGFSAALIGSGFACDFQIFSTLMKKLEAVGGFDKELELLLLKGKIKIGYAHDAILFDEKVQLPSAFVNQRRRWLSAQMVYLKANVINGYKNLFLHGNLDYFDKVVQFMLPPRVISLGLTIVFAALNLIAFVIYPLSIFGYGFGLWSAVFAVSALSVGLSIPFDKFNSSMVKSIIALPLGFALTVKALLKTKGANTNFIHTAHSIN